ncbi:MAG: 50S ribosomal protein L3 [Oligoflexia bacterium]|nr:50S ribosomal protein L3 [Oligoflexia bacterium]
MSEQNTNTQETKLEGLYAFKVGMTQFIDDKGEMHPCTVLKYEPLVVSQVKTMDKDGYSAVQVAAKPKRKSRAKKVQTGHFKKANLQTGAYFVNEIKSKADGLQLGATVSINSLSKGDMVKATAVSKGKGFAGAVKRWNSGGGPGSHGSTFHRQPGSSGNRTWPGRIMKGKHFPGHLGDEKVTVRNIKVLDVIGEDNLVILRGCVPGGKNALVRLLKQ